jgi:RHS repeat-associated protein
VINLKQGTSNYSYLYDGKGNITAVLDSSQAVVATYTYDPFGALVSKTGTLDQPYMFSTKEYDIQTGLSYYGYRFYNPSVGRWMTRDPLEESVGINLYEFVLNNPVNIIDPEGLTTCKGTWRIKGVRHEFFSRGCLCWWLCEPCDGTSIWSGDFTKLKDVTSGIGFWSGYGNPRFATHCSCPKPGTEEECCPKN